MPTCCSRALSRADRSGSICSRVKQVRERRSLHHLAPHITTLSIQYPTIHRVHKTHLLWFAPASVVSATWSSSAGKASFAVGERFRRQEDSGPTNFFSSFAPAAHPTMHRHSPKTSVTAQDSCKGTIGEIPRVLGVRRGHNSKAVHAGAVTWWNIFGSLGRNRRG